MNSRDFLPFPRGSTASAKDTKIAGPNGLVSMIPTATGNVAGATPFRPDLAGKIFNDKDDHAIGDATSAATTSGLTLAPGTGQPIKLRAVQIGGADLTVTYVGQLVGFSTTAKEFGVVTAAPATGGVCKPLDPLIPVGTVLKKWDWCYVIEEGPTYMSVANGQSVTAQGPVAAYSTGGQCGPAAASHFVVAVADAAKTGGATAANTLVYVKDGLAVSEAAG